MSQELDNLSDSEFESNLEDLSCGFVRTHNEVIELEQERMKENAHETAESVRVAEEFHGSGSAQGANKDIRKAKIQDFWQKNKKDVKMANNDNYEKEEIQSDNPIIQKCLGIIRNPKAWVEDLANAGYYSVYIGNKKYFTFNRGYFLGTEYTITVKLQDYNFCGKRPDLKELHRLCVAKYKEQSQERKKNALDFLNDVDKAQKANKNNGTAKLVLLMGLAIAGIISPAVIRGIQEKKAQRVKKQVEAYEKTLPGYLEQKQAVEHYRDSLMRAKGR